MSLANHISENIPVTPVAEDVWKILIVDDEAEVHRVTRMVLDEVEFENKPLRLISAFSSIQALAILQEQTDISLILLDVVMETELAGLDLVRKLRYDLGNSKIRIILRTGQPGQAPEQKVVVEYDINDYKEKTELTAAKLFTTIISSLRAYRDICNIEKQKIEIDRKSRLNAFILKAMPCETLLILRSGAVISCSHAARKNLSTPQKSCPGRPGNCGEQCFWSPVKLPMESTKPMQWEIMVNTAPHEISFFPVENYVCLVYAFDITEKKRHEQEKKVISQQLIHAEKMEAIGLLASGMAHDFNNQLTGISGCLSLMKKQNPEMPVNQRYLNIIQESVLKASKLVMNLLTFSRRGKMAREPVDINQVIADTIDLIRPRSKRIFIQFKKNTPHALVMGNIDQLQNALINLSINAFDAMPDSGTLTFETAEFSPHRSTAEPFFLQITIADTGVGMSEEIKQHIFEPFFTTKEPGKGTGLGLSSVYGCIQNHQGTITVESTVNQGTVFTILLPMLSEEPAKGKDLQEATAQKQVYCQTIYIGEQDPILASLAKRFLTDIGLTVKTFDSSEKLLNHIRQNPEENIDLFLLNLQWPDIDSIETFSELKKVYASPRAVFVHQQYDQEIILKRCDDGVAGLLPKGFTKEIFYDIIARALKKVELLNRTGGRQ